MKTKGATNVFILIFLVVAAIVVSALVSTLTANVEWLKWLTWGESIGIDTVTLDLAIINLSFSFRMQINALQILCIGIALFIHNKFF